MQRMKKFLRGELPATMRDASRTAEMLGLRYICVDFIQDDEAEWSIGELQMGSVNRRATVTPRRTAQMMARLDSSTRSRDPTLTGCLSLDFGVDCRLHVVSTVPTLTGPNNAVTRDT